MPLPYPDHELLSQPVQYPNNNPPYVPRVELLHEAESLLTAASAAVANEASYMSGQSGPRVFCYNMLSDMNWANNAFADVVKMVCDTAVLMFRDGQYGSPHLALNSAVKETLTLFTSMLIVTHPDLMRSMAPEHVRAAEDNFRVYEDRISALGALYNRGAPVRPGYGGRPGNPPVAPAVRSYGARPPAVRPTALAHPGGGGATPPARAPQQSRVQRDQAKTEAPASDKKVEEKVTHITGEIEKMDRDAHSIIYFGQKYKVPTPPLRRRFEEAVEHQEAAAERKKPSETHYDKTVLAGSSLGEIGVMARGRYLSKFADGLDIFSTVGLVAHPVLSVESLDVLRNKLKACGTFADLGTVLSRYAQEAPSGAGLRIALDAVSQIDRVLTGIVNDFLANSLSLPKVRVTSFVEDAPSLGKYLSDKYNGMYNKAYTNYQRDVMEELFLDLAGVGQVDLGEAAGEPVDVYASVGDTGGWHSMQLTVAYNLLYVTATAAELGYTIEGAPKRMTPEGTPLLHRLIKAVRAQSSLLNIRTSQILLVTSDGARYAIHRSYEDGDVYNAVEV